MKKLLKLLSIALALCLVIGFVPFSGSAEAAYTYTVTVYSGKEGTFADGSDTYTLKNLKYGDVVSLSGVVNGVVLNSGSKYYVKGVRLSGHDNSEVSGTAFKVTGDAIYVVAYGVKGNLVEYTVNFLDTAGNQLIPSRTYYGNVGDKAIATYEYIDGYQPAAYNLAKTLSANSSLNIFNFTYIKAPESNVIVIDNGNTTGNGDDNANDDDNANADDNTATQPGDLVPSTLPDSTVVEDNQANEDAAGTQEIVDLDELETPTSESPEEDDEEEGSFFEDILSAFSGWSPWAYGAAAAVGFGGLTFLFYLLFSPKKKDEEDEEDKDSE